MEKNNKTDLEPWKKPTNHKEQPVTMKFNKIFIQLENQGIAHH